MVNRKSALHLIHDTSDVVGNLSGVFFQITGRKPTAKELKKARQQLPISTPSRVVTEVQFSCAVCDKEAGLVSLQGTPAKPRLSCDSFICNAGFFDISNAKFEALKKALTNKDASALYSIDYGYAPFYCPKCKATYCGEHWQWRDVFSDDHPAWHDATRAWCPKGHERIISD